ncbi:Kinesin-like protein Klp10A [Papilio machaon]|uniref:Kinesin-like protein Klp10A n=1 Tax=Papilio machaon TaxID=76193 RepID=A0A0N1I5S7_PAPMA|nr:Kinesin-like protein Klp10A [Papilio machaon]
MVTENERVRVFCMLYNTPSGRERRDQKSTAESFCLNSSLFNNLNAYIGRIHSAIVSGVNLETRSVTVEWFERGETKGKEVEIDTILALNPELIGTRRSPHLQPVSNAPNKLAREPSGSSSDEGGFLREGADADGDAGHTLPVRNSRSDMTRQSIPVATKVRYLSAALRLTPPSRFIIATHLGHYDHVNIKDALNFRYSHDGAFWGLKLPRRSVAATLLIFNAVVLLGWHNGGNIAYKCRQTGRARTVSGRPRTTPPPGTDAPNRKWNTRNSAVILP